MKYLSRFIHNFKETIYDINFKIDIGSKSQLTITELDNDKNLFELKSNLLL